MSSYYDDASLMLLASGGAQKDGKVYSVKPTDGSGDFTFTRGSNLSATRVNASQLIEKGRENLALQSNQFDTTWGISGASRTSGQSGYDGLNNAWKIESTNTGQSRLNQAVSISGVNTISFYAKAGTANYIMPYIIGSGDPRVFFNLSTGTIEQSVGTIDASIEDAGNGWYRCSMAFDRTSNSLWIFIGNTNGSFNSAVGDSIYIQDAQLESSLVATPYIETGATSAQAGILENTPRFDYSGGATCPSLLLEPSRTNQCTQSEYIGSIDWNQAGITRSLVITQTSETNPEGASICWKIQGTASDNQLANNSSTNSGTTITNSIYVKRVSGTGNVFLRDVNNNHTSFSLSVADGWKRIDVTGTATSATARFYLNLQVSTDEILVWGAQQEIGAYPTSYIPTYGVSQTRAFDDCAVNYTNISDTGGTIFWQGFVDIGVDSHAISLSNSANGTGSNRILFYRSTSDNKVWLYIQSAGVSVKNISLQLPTDSNDKYAVSWATNDFAVYINGAQIYTSSSGAIPTGMQYIQLNEWTNAHTETNVTKQALYFTTRLSNLDLAILTGATTYNTFAEMALALNYTVYE